MNKITSFLLLVFLSVSCTSSNSDGDGDDDDGDKMPLAAPVEIDGKWGYVDKNGKTAINPLFEDAKDFQEGLARVQLGSKWGYIDKNGKMAIKPQFDWAGEFKEGLALIRLGSKWGYIGKNGETAINPQFDYADDFQEGRARILLGSQWGYIDKTGKIAANLQFDGAEDFGEERAGIKLGGKDGYADKTEKTAIKPKFDFKGWFQEGLARIKLGGKWGYISKARKMASNLQFNGAEDFQEMIKVPQGEMLLATEENQQTPPVQQTQPATVDPKLEEKRRKSQARKERFENDIAQAQAEIDKENQTENPDKVKIKMLEKKIKIAKALLRAIGLNRSPVVEQERDYYDPPPVQDEEPPADTANGIDSEGEPITIDRSEDNFYSPQTGLSQEDQELKEKTQKALQKLKMILGLEGDEMPSFNDYIRYMIVQYTKAYGKAGKAKMEEFFGDFVRSWRLTGMKIEKEEIMTVYEDNFSDVTEEKA